MVLPLTFTSISHPHTADLQEVVWGWPRGAILGCLGCVLSDGDSHVFMSDFRWLKDDSTDLFLSVVLDDSLLHQCIKKELGEQGVEVVGVFSSVADVRLENEIDSSLDLVIRQQPHNPLHLLLFDLRGHEAVCPLGVDVGVEVCPGAGDGEVIDQGRKADVGYSDGEYRHAVHRALFLLQPGQPFVTIGAEEESLKELFSGEGFKESITLGTN